jgi:hypothetical protein
LLRLRAGLLVVVVLFVPVAVGPPEREAGDVVRPPDGDGAGLVGGGLAVAGEEHEGQRSAVAVVRPLGGGALARAAALEHELEKEEELTDELPTLVNRAGDELIKARPTINELLRRAHQLEECRAEQHKMLQEIMMLKRCLKELHRKELLITQGIDPDQLLSML